MATFAQCKQNLKLWFSQVRTFFKALFPHIEVYIATHIEPIIHFMNAVKAVVENPATDVLVHLIPGTVPEAILNGIETGIDKILEVLGLIEAVEKTATFAQKIQVIATWIGTHPDVIQDDIIRRIASLLAYELAPTEDQKMDTVWRDTIIQNIYNAMYHEKNPDKPVLVQPATTDSDLNITPAPTPAV